MCCCGKNRSVRCQRENHCYKKCPSTKAGGGNGQPLNAYIASASSSSSATIVADMGALIGHDDGAQMEPFTSAVAILQTAAAGIKATQGTGLSKAVASVVKEAGQLLDVAVAQVTAYAQNHKAASHPSISVPASGYKAPSSFSPFTGASMLNAACLRAAAFHRQKGKVSMEEAREMEGKDSDGNDVCDEYDDDSDGSSGTRMPAESHTGDDSSDESSDFHQGRGRGARGSRGRRGGRGGRGARGGWGGRGGRGGSSGKGKGSKRGRTYEDDDAYVDEDDEELSLAEDGSVCGACGKGGKEDEVLLCDFAGGCEAEYHMSCLRPRLTKIPDGDWFCPMHEGGRAASDDEDEETESASKRSKTGARRGVRSRM